MFDCFAYTYKTLARKGYKFKEEFKGYSVKNLKQIMADREVITGEDLHHEYFKEFCDVVEEAQADDIVVCGKTVGVAFNKLKYYSVHENSNNIKLVTISPDCVVYRIRSEEVEVVETPEEVEEIIESLEVE